ncbi:hypothetical protein ACHAWU_004861 [Discostella pseudostelligera]|uniref:Uncharacterized protein n=1 Tax=Discostella pseudostelligera TaxID=259834 RepID=A0ABD3M2M7_9STRA
MSQQQQPPASALPFPPHPFTAVSSGTGAINSNTATGSMSNNSSNINNNNCSDISINNSNNITVENGASSPQLRCAICSHHGADLRLIGGCACAYHARCIDLVGLIHESRRLKQQQNQLHEKHPQEMQIDTDSNVGDNSNSSSSSTTNSEEDISITTCPVCQRYDITGVEIVPLSFAELDKARRLIMMAHAGLLKKRMAVGNEMMMGGSSSSTLGDAGVAGSSGGSAVGRGRDGTDNTSTVATTSSTTVTTTAAPPPSSSSATINSSTSQFYDPSMPRTGRWTDDELAFRDALVAHFDAGSLPLSNGIKLNDFLSSMLKSKQSRLTKKMKHAKLSSKYFRIHSGYLMRERDSSSSIGGVGGACTFSNLEYNFIHSIADPIERSEIAFHMQREWREHIVERLTYLRINFDATSWLQSVDSMERRVALEKNRSRLAKRRNLMGKAMEKDISENMPGVFINQRVDDIAEVVGSDMKIRRIGDYDASGGGAEMRSISVSSMPQAAVAGGSLVASSDGHHDEDGELNRFLMSMLDEAPIATNTIGAVHHTSHHDEDSALASSSVGGKKSNATLRSSCDPNFRYAAPFLAGITSYMERHGVPFEYVDIWVPSVVPPALERELSTPFIGSMGSGSNPTNTSSPGGETCLDESGGNQGVFRLCFAGSATLGVQIVDQSSSLDSLSIKDDAQKKENTSHEMNVYPLTGDEIYNFSLFGQYSSKFSFSSGCGLPGRVFQSGIAAWEQFVANAPPEMFERRGGAIQFGIKTALGLPIDCVTVGRIVLVLYSKHNREKDEELVNRMVKDVRMFNPCPRWKLVVDMGGASDPSRVSTQPPPQPVSAGLIGAPPAANGFADSSKNDEIMSLVTLLQEYMPSDQQSLLGPQLNSMMLLRMTLLRTNRTPEEEQLIDMMLVLFKSYIAAGRTRQDIATLLTRDYDFHILQLQNQVSSQPQRLETPATNQMGQHGALLQRVSMMNRINPLHFQSEISPTTTAAPPGTFSPPFEIGGFPSTPFT